MTESEGELRKVTESDGDIYVLFFYQKDKWRNVSESDKKCRNVTGIAEVTEN